jgi:2,3-bisphosphoglycerate-independent phosphoglycerate mutase
MARPSSSTPGTRPVVLVILDGWGIGPEYPGNAISLADTPTMDMLSNTYPSTVLETSGLAVGLPEGQMGNSEVGHLNIGAGFVVYQWITRINRAIEVGEFHENETLVALFNHCRDYGRRLHCIGLIGDGGVHSHSDHMIATVSTARDHGLREVFVHAITDGRDTPPTSGRDYLEHLQDELRRIGTGRVVSVMGRYYAMDRDKRWDRTKRAYDTLTQWEGSTFTSAQAVLDVSYRNGTTDEFIQPAKVQPPGSSPVVIEPGDALFFTNFRADRGRQLVEALSLPDFLGFERPIILAGSILVATMTRYEEGLPVLVAFEPHDVEYPLARIISEAGLKQAHIAETEKYAHVTFFLNGGREKPFPGESRFLVPSPKVPTYDLQPEMSADQVADAVVEAIDSEQFGFIVVNFANGDMVGHTGDINAAVQAIGTVDRCLGEILNALGRHHGVALVTADHGNSEEMLDPATGATLTAHTTNVVPFILVTPDDHPLRHSKLRDGGSLPSIAPTVLSLLEIPIPEAMTSPSLLPSGAPVTK